MEDLTTVNFDKEIEILHFNDVYNAPRAPQFLTAINLHRTANSFLLFSGDVISPSILSNITNGKHMIEVLNEFNLDCSVLGNHDLDFGVDNFIECKEMSNFPWINSNCLDKITQSPLGNCNEWEIIEKAGTKIGLIGIVEKEWVATLSAVDSDDVDVEDIVVKSNYLIDKLIDEHGCDLIIALTHMRWPNDRKLAKLVPRLDLVLGGHDHNYGVETHNGCYVIKSGTDFQEFSKIKLKWSGDKTSRSNRVQVKVERIEVDSSYEPDEKLSKLLEKTIGDFEIKQERVLGNIEVDMDARFESVRVMETNVGNLIADIILQAVDADCAIYNSGTLRIDKIIPAGPFTMKDLNMMLPLVDPIIVIAVTGQQLLDSLENGVSMVPKLEGRFPQVSGIRFSYSLNSSPRVLPESVYIQNKPLDINCTYRLAAKEYLTIGKDGYTMFENCEVLLDSENGPCLNTIVQNFFLTINVLLGFKTLRVAHYQNLLSRKMVRSLTNQNLPKVNNNNSEQSKWKIIRSAIMDMEKNLCLISPKVEGRITRVD